MEVENYSLIQKEPEMGSPRLTCLIISLEVQVDRETQWFSPKTIV